VFLRDRQSGITRRINIRPEGQESFFPVNAPAISMTPDGRFDGALRVAVEQPDAGRSSRRG